MTIRPGSTIIKGSSPSGLLRPLDPPIKKFKIGVEFLLNFIEVLPLYLCLACSCLLNFIEFLSSVEFLKPLCGLSLSKKFINSIHSFIHTYIPTLRACVYTRVRGAEFLERHH